MTLLLLALLGCADEAPTPAEAAPALTKVRLALNWLPEPEFGGFYEGVASGLYAARGFDVEIIPGGPGAPTLELLTAGRAEAAITAGEDLLIKRARGVAAIGVWAAFQHSPAGLMAHEGGPERIADIAGGRIAIEVGAPFQRFLWGRFGWEGKVEAVPYGGSIGPFLADPTLIQQAYVTSEPCLARAQGAAVRFLPASDAGWDPYGVVVALADPPPAWTADFVAATKDAWLAYLADPSRGNAEIARQNDQLKPELLSCISEAQRPFVEGDDGLGAMTAARWGATAATLAELGLLSDVDGVASAWRAVE